MYSEIAQNNNKPSSGHPIQKMLQWLITPGTRGAES